MKAVFEQINTQPESSFTWLQLCQPQFEMPYHFHPQLELTWIQRSKGKRYLGGNVFHYYEDDLVLVGSNTPHCWLSQPTENQQEAQALVIQFDPDFLGASFWDIPEMSAINNLLKKAVAGIQITGKTQEHVIRLLKVFAQSQGFYKLHQLMEILHFIAISDEIVLIDKNVLVHQASFPESERFQKVFQYLIEHYQNEVTLDAVAKIAHLTPTAFCRFFKSVTNKTLVEVLIDFRIHQACSLLSTTDKPIVEVCYESGFGNSSYFNKKFKALLGVTPLEYRKEHRQKNIQYLKKY